MPSSRDNPLGVRREETQDAGSRLPAGGRAFACRGANCRRQLLAERGVASRREAFCAAGEELLQPQSLLRLVGPFWIDDGPRAIGQLNQVVSVLRPSHRSHALDSTDTGAGFHP